jgi:hypothetical protein
MTPPTLLCSHPALVRQGDQVCCSPCGASCAVPRCPKCKPTTPCPQCKPSAACVPCRPTTTWIVRGPDLVCYKCETSVPGLSAHAMP